MPDGQIHDVVYLCSMANTVWAFDANDGTMLWPGPASVGIPVDGTADIDRFLINDHWGILSTPVIDRDTDTLYLVSWSSPDGSVANATHALHALSIIDGISQQPPLNFEGVTYDPGHSAPVQEFKSAARKQRPALLLTRVPDQHSQVEKTIFVAFGSVKETTANSRGWVIACSLSPFTIAAAWASTAKGQGGGIWMGGRGCLPTIRDSCTP